MYKLDTHTSTALLILLCDYLLCVLWSTCNLQYCNESLLGTANKDKACPKDPTN